MRLIVMPGDGIGPEITTAALEVPKPPAAVRLGPDLRLRGRRLRQPGEAGTTLRQDVLEKAKAYDGIILGTQSHADYPPPEKGGRNISASFRVGLDLYANVRPARTRPFLATNMREGRTMDLVIMREATEGFYADRNMTRGSGECMPSPDMALATRKITRHCSERIARDCVRTGHDAPQEGDGHPQGQLLPDDRRPVPRSRARRRQGLSRGRATTTCWSMPRPRIWCATPSAST